MPRLGETFIASNQQKKKGVVLYIKKHLKPKLVFTSEDGRLLMVEISYEGEEILLVNIYAPNESQHNFFLHLKTQLTPKAEQKICIMGDFNAVVNKEKDTSTSNGNGRKRTRNIIHKVFLEMAEELTLIEIQKGKIIHFILIDTTPGQE